MPQLCTYSWYARARRLAAAQDKTAPCTTGPTEGWYFDKYNFALPIFSSGWSLWWARTIVTSRLLPGGTTISIAVVAPDTPTATKYPILHHQRPATLPSNLQHANAAARLHAIHERRVSSNRRVA
jgi:hypothetical protein